MEYTKYKKIRIKGAAKWGLNPEIMVINNGKRQNKKS